MVFICNILLLLCTLGIAYQDFKNRLISIWLIFLFGITQIVWYILKEGVYQLLENIVCCISYFLFIYFTLLLFYFIKTKKIQKILDEKMGWGDIWISLFIGMTIRPDHLVFFFTACFISALFFHFLFTGREKNIALAAILILCNAMYFIYGALPISF